jgi:glycosyltransferase involved in cell wall biosynthesis
MIALITPTGARPQQIQLCVEWMKRQIYKGEVLWVVVDDAVPITTDFIQDDFKQNWKVVRCYPRPKWEQGQNTQKRNLLAAVNELEKHDGVDYVFIIEDDDYYTPEYLDKMVRYLKGYDAVGQTKSTYFNVVTGKVKKHSNTRHSSLFQTAIHINKLRTFKDILSSDASTFIDIHLWGALQGSKVHLFNSVDLSIGMKGLPGRDGIGIGHRVKGVSFKYPMKKKALMDLIGIDYEKYEPWIK